MAIWVFYKLLLEKLTFFVANRFFLLGSIVVAFWIAVGHFTWLDTLFQNQMGTADFDKYVPSTNLPSFNPFTQWVPLSSISLAVYGMGVIFLGANLGIQYFSYLKLKRSASLREIKGQPIYVVSQDILPFSFGKSVFIAESAVTNPEIGKILLHESIHVQQNHSVDILLAEIVRIINWINPFAWLLKNSMRQNLEFLTDAMVINNGIDKKMYQYLLLHFSGNNPFNLVTNFNFYSLKTRISKMNQNKSNQLQYSRFLLFIPMVLVLVFVFSCMNEQVADEIPSPEPKEKLSLVEPDSQPFVTKPDGSTQKQLKKNGTVGVLEAKMSRLQLDKPNQNQPKQALLLQKVKKSSQEVSEELPPPPPPPVPAKK